MNNASYRDLTRMGRGRITEIARAAQVSRKQAAAQIARAVKKGYVKVVKDHSGELIYESRQKRMFHDL